jgi:hypothetical protein
MAGSRAPLRSCCKGYSTYVYLIDMDRLDLVALGLSLKYCISSPLVFLQSSKVLGYQISTTFRRVTLILPRPGQHGLGL